MDQFYQELRKIQKKERNNATLARVEEDFYTTIHEYLDELRQEAIRDPFSNVHGMLKEAQIIATEICERREHKITDAAVVNIHRSYHLFTGKPQFDLVDTTPLNLTPEEEKFYFSLIDTLKNHRGNISLDKLSDDDKPEKKVIKPKETQKTKLKSARPNQLNRNQDSLLKSKSTNLKLNLKSLKIIQMLLTNRTNFMISSLKKWLRILNSLQCWFLTK